MKKVEIKEYGFTLIELLAVILILGIISLIAVPTVNDIIKDSKRQSFLVSSKTISDAISDTCTANLLSGQNDNGTYSIVNGVINYDVDLKGKLPDSGTVNINDNCEVEMLSIQDNYCAYKNYSDDRFTMGNVVNNECQIEDAPIVVEPTPTKDSCFVFDASTGTITDYNINDISCQGNVVIPKQIGGVDVTAIASGAFLADYDYLIQKSFPNGYTYDVYDSTTPLVSYGIYPVIGIPQDLTKTCYLTSEEVNGEVVPFNTQDSKYDWCKFNDFSMNGSDFSINSIQRVETTGITSIDFSKATSLTTIGAAISAYGSLNRVIFGNLPNLTEIGPSAFVKNNITGTVDLSGLPLLTQIRSNLFEGNKIENVIFNDNLEVIWHYGFNGNEITSLNLSEKLEHIMIQAFSFNDIQNLVLPNSLQTIRDFAFYENENMGTVKFGTDLYGIMKQVFYNCGLTSADFSSVTALEGISDKAFQNNRLTSLNINARYYYANAFNDNLLETVEIGNRVVQIRAGVFSNNPTLQTITIHSAYSSGSPWGAPASVTINHVS